MTATQPRVTTLKSVAVGRPPALSPAPEVDRASASDIDVRTRATLHWSLVVMRVLVIMGLVAVAYVAVSDNWVAGGADALVGWYSTAIAPHLAIDFTVMEPPTYDSGVFGPAPTSWVVVSD